MIRMFCDRCGEEIEPEVNGGVRLRTANQELSFHLCAMHQGEFRVLAVNFCAINAPRGVQPSLKGG